MNYIRPNYDAARKEAGFRWSVVGCYHAVRHLAEVPMKDFNLKPEVCIEAYKVGRARLRQMFGDWLPPLPPATPPVSYGHVNCLGSELLFPDIGEVAHTHPYTSLEEGIRRLKQPVDFAREGMAPFYLDFWEKMKAAFPDESVGFSFGLEGPITTAYELRGEAFFTDLFDSPDLLPEFLELMTRSIVDYHHFCSRLTGAESVDPGGAGLVDDIASFVPPRLFPRYVMPYWEQYYAGVTTGRRSAHVEDLKRTQLSFLEDIGLNYYDPSISHKLNPRMIAEEIRVPFGWRLGSFHYRGMDEQDVRDFVFQAAADGASQVFTIIEAALSDEEGVRKVTAFKQAGEEVERLLGQGCSRAELGSCVSERGRARFWDHWPE